MSSTSSSGIFDYSIHSNDITESSFTDEQMDRESCFTSSGSDVHEIDNDLDGLDILSHFTEDEILMAKYVNHFPWNKNRMYEDEYDVPIEPDNYGLDDTQKLTIDCLNNLNYMFLREKYHYAASNSVDIYRKYVAFNLKNEYPKDHSFIFVGEDAILVDYLKNTYGITNDDIKYVTLNTGNEGIVETDVTSRYDVPRPRPLNEGHINTQHLYNEFIMCLSVFPCNKDGKNYNKLYNKRIYYGNSECIHDTKYTSYFIYIDLAKFL